MHGERTESGVSGVSGAGLRLLAAVLAAGLLAGSARALEPATPLASYARQSWAMENGLAQNTVEAVAQTRDGFVWIGTEVGLERFDGVSFQLFDRNSAPALPGNDVRCLLAASDGTLWVGTSEGLARLKDGAVAVFTTANGLPRNDIRELREDKNGTVIVSTGDGEVGLKGTTIVPMHFDKLEAVNPALNPVFSSQLPDGRAVRSTTSTVTIFEHKRDLDLRIGRELPGSKIQQMIADREGALWIGTNSGLVRWFAGRLQRFPVTEPLASASVLALMEDREGNLWVGTETDGLHILRDQRFRTVGSREGLSADATTTVVEDAAGTLWVGTAGDGLNAVKNLQVEDRAFPGPQKVGDLGHPALSAGNAEKAVNPALAHGRQDSAFSTLSEKGADRMGHPEIRHYTVREGLLSDVILSLAAAKDGSLWVGTPDGLNRIRGGHVDGFTSADGLPDDFVRSLLADSDGSLWIGTRRGLAHWKRPGTLGAGAMEILTTANGLGSDLVGAMARDGKGDLWVATLAGLSRLKNGKFTTYTTANGLPSNVITALLVTYDDFLVIGTQDHGIEIWDPEGSLKADGPILQNRSVRAVTQDEGGHLWLATADGLTRCDGSKSGIVRFSGVANCIDFGTADGLRGRETAANSHPSAWRGRDGRLWFATPKGLVEVDPAHFPVNATPPPVVLERFTVDDALRAADSWTRVEAGHVHFEFDYAALSFVAPQKVRYRYMLEGFDKTWTEAGARRTAYYTNIPPGHYTFRVQAANNDGVWNTEGAALKFELRPHFYQTVWFYLLLAAFAAGLIVLMQRERLRRAEREFKAVLGERNRIAREIHDTLAQGYVGISMQLEVLNQLLRMNKTEAAAKHLDTTRELVREGLADARQSIWALRSQDTGETTLPVRMRRIVEQAGGHGLEARFNIFGAYRPLPPGTEQEILRIAQEAVHNVSKHAGAAHLTVQLEYGREEIALEVRDDGRGFDVNADASSPSGHFGLTGMRERATAIGGTLDVTSEPGAGTTVRLRARARREAHERSGE